MKNQVRFPLYFLEFLHHFDRADFLRPCRSIIQTEPLIVKDLYHLRRSYWGIYPEELIEASMA